MRKDRTSKRLADRRAVDHNRLDRIGVAPFVGRDVSLPDAMYAFQVPSIGRLLATTTRRVARQQCVPNDLRFKFAHRTSFRSSTNLKLPEFSGISLVFDRKSESVRGGRRGACGPLDRPMEPPESYCCQKPEGNFLIVISSPLRTHQRSTQIRPPIHQARVIPVEALDRTRHIQNVRYTPHLPVSIGTDLPLGRFTHPTDHATSH